MKKKWSFALLLSTLLLVAGCTEVDETSNVKEESTPKKEVVETTKNETETKETVTAPAKEEPKETVKEEPKESAAQNTGDLFAGYKKIEADACNLSGARQTKVVVDIGYGDREYWAFTNEHGQLVRVVAEKITLQNDNTEKVNSSGRYCNDEAKVPGVERSDLDEGHVIADSLGGVSNAYNITPQDSTLNRHGDQAYMERAIRDAGGATNFEAIIAYPNTKTQIPSHYKYTYTIKGHTVTDSFGNGNPDKINEQKGLTGSNQNGSTASNQQKPSTPSSQSGDLASVDKNGNGKVTIQEAKDAGYKMPITRDHWLYQYMDDRDGDGVVGE